MKILHTSDWHIGHKLYSNDRTAEHNLFFDWLTKTIEKEKIDVLLVCGDIFDVGYPSNLALKTYYRFLKNMIGTACKKVIITGGNHDFVSTLEAPQQILELLNVTVIGGVPENLQNEIIELKNGENETEVVIGAVPFLRDKDIRTPVAGESSDERIKATRDGIAQHYHNLAEFTQHFKNQKIPVIATGHLYMQGSQLSESERDIQLGNQAGVNAAAFPETFDYYALGHIHRAQIISKNPDMVYSGSPMALSFSEQNNKKSVQIIEISGANLHHHILEVPQFRKVKSFEGSFENIQQEVKNYTSESELPDWIEIKIAEDEYDPLLARATDQFVEDINRQNSNFEIIRHTLTFANRNLSEYLIEETGKTLSDLKEKEVFERLLERQGITETGELINSFNELLELVHTSENLDLI